MNIDVKTPSPRSTCIACGRKKERKNMVQHGQHWTCKDCLQTPTSAELSKQVAPQLKALNLYSGIGGNRKLWPGNVQVTAVELNAKVAAAYKEMFPEDIVIVGDAHEYLLKHYYKFNFIWVSSPCQSHSRMNYWTTPDKKRYPDLSLYEEIILLKNFCKGKFVIENVNPYYTPLITPDAKISRHLFWTNFKVTPVHVPNIENFINLDDVRGKKLLMEWLDIHYEKNLYLSGKDYLQVFRNCVHPKIGLSIFNDAFNL